MIILYLVVSKIVFRLKISKFNFIILLDHCDILAEIRITTVANFCEIMESIAQHFYSRGIVQWPYVHEKDNIKFCCAHNFFLRKLFNGFGWQAAIRNATRKIKTKIARKRTSMAPELTTAHVYYTFYSNIWRLVVVTWKMHFQNLNKFIQEKQVLYF